VKAAGASNNQGLTDSLYREGLTYYWDQKYSLAIPKFEEVKRLFPQHSEVDKLIQSSQQAKSEGKERADFPYWIVAVVFVVLIVIGLIIIIGIIALIMSRRKKRANAAASSDKGGKHHAAPSPVAYSPSPSPSPKYSPTPAKHSSPPPPMPMPAVHGGDQGMTVDLSRTIAITDTAPVSYGSIKFVSGALAGKEFQVKPDGEFVGRDSSTAQVVIPDPRISKRHLWIGVRDGRVIIVDQESRNGTFVNDPKSSRVTETSLNPGDTVILGESDVARFEYLN